MEHMNWLTQNEALINGGKILLIIVVTWAILQWKKVIHRKIIRTHAVDFLPMEFVGRFSTLLIFFLSLLLILGVLGVDVVPLLTVSGIGAAVVGLASRDIIANFFSGLMIYITRPFSVGEAIEMPAKQLQVTVEEIGWYYAAIRDPQKRLIYVPNTIFSTDILLNHSQITHRRIEEVIQLPPMEGKRVLPLIEEIRKLLKQEAKIDQQQPIDVFLCSLKPVRKVLKQQEKIDQQEPIDAFLYSLIPGGLEIEVKAYSLATQYEEFMEVKQKILLGIYHIVAKATHL
jgi:MscS family membrane protein